MQKNSKRIAVIVNGATENSPESLEQTLLNNGCQVDLFDVHKMRSTSDGFEIQRGENWEKIDPAKYDIVCRVIKGAVSGDTEKSWELQAYFENGGAKPHISVESAKKITDKVICRNALIDCGVPVTSAVVIPVDEKKEPFEFQSAIKELGDPPFAVRKSLGSGKGCVQIAATADEAMSIVMNNRSPKGPNGVIRGSIVHTLPKPMDIVAAEKYQISGVDNIDKRPHHFRVVIIDGEVFATHVCLSEVGKFGLNPAQGTMLAPVSPQLLPEKIMELANNAANAIGLKVAAIDIAMGLNQLPQVLDMNANPDLSQVNHQGISIKQAFAASIQNTQTGSMSSERAATQNIILRRLNGGRG